MQKEKETHRPRGGKITKVAGELKKNGRRSDWGEGCQGGRGIQFIYPGRRRQKRFFYATIIESFLKD